MIAHEIIIILTLLSGGSLLLKALGLKGWPVWPLGFLSGIVLYTTLLYAKSLTLRMSPTLPLVATLVLPLLFYAWQWYRGRDVKFKLLPAAAALAITAALVTGFGHANLARFHSDSLNFMLVGSAIGRGDPTSISNYNIENRLSTVPAVHSLGHYSGNFYLTSITPLISLAILATICWVVIEATRGKASRRQLILYCAAPVLVLASSHAYLFHSFYLNGHLMMGAFMLMAAAAGWLLCQKGNKVSELALVAIIALGLAGAVFTRVEGLFYAGIILLPIVLHPQPRLMYKRLLIAALGLSIVLQEGLKIILLRHDHGNVNLKTDYLPLALGVILLPSAILVGWKFLAKHWQKLVWLTEIGVWLAMLALFIHKPQTLKNSVIATYKNINATPVPWGKFFVMLIILMGMVLIFRRFKDQAIMRLSITTFLPIAFILAYLRGAPYRFGQADSLDRMMISLVPLAVLFITLSIITGQSRFKSIAKK